MQTNPRYRLAAMSAFGQKSTGLPNIVIWLIPGDGGQHAPRIKVSNIRGKARFDNKDCFSVSIPTDPTKTPAVVAGSSEFSAKELKQILGFVQNNVPQLLSLWCAECLPEDVTFTKV